jgi:hypothetical protein
MDNDPTIVKYGNYIVYHIYYIWTKYGKYVNWCCK